MKNTFQKNSIAKFVSESVNNLPAPLVTGLCLSLLSAPLYATDYTSTITGPFNFLNGDSVTVSSGQAVIASGADKKITSTGTLTLKNTGSTGHGLVAQNGGSITSTGTTIINTVGSNSNGVFSTGANSVINLAGVVDVTTTGSNNAKGLIAAAGGVINDTGKVTIKTTGDHSYGVQALNKNSAVNLADADITTSDVRAFGLEAENGGAITSTGKVVINTANSVAVGAYTGSTINLKDANIKAGGANSHGIEVTGGSSLTSTGKTTIATTGGYGVRVADGSVASLADVDIISTTANTSAIGLYARGNGSKINVSGTATLNTTGKGVHAEDGAINLVNTNINTSGGSSLYRANGLSATAGGVVTASGKTTLNTTGNYAEGVSVQGAGSVINVADIDIATSGNAAAGVFATNEGTFNSSGTTTINTKGKNSVGVQQNGPGSQVNLNGPASITTTGVGSHGYQVINGAVKTFDNTAGNILPMITVSGDGAALVDASGAGSELHLGDNATLNMAMTAGVNTWGAKAENDGTVFLEGNSNTGGTGLWATGKESKLVLADTANTAGSRVKLDGSSSLNINNLAAIGSLEGQADSSVIFGNALADFILGQNNTENNGSLVDNADFAGHFQNAEGVKLQKTGTSTQILSGLNNRVGSVNVTGGDLQFMQEGVFNVTGDYTTHNGATTTIGQDNSALNIGGTFTQEAGSHLNVILDSGADIIADNMVLAGHLAMDGFAASSDTAPVKASEVSKGVYEMFHTTNGFSGDFDNNPLGASELDYLTGGRGEISADGKDYDLRGFHVAWTDGGQAQGTGSFTLVEGTAFDVDTVLADQNVPDAGFASGWDGKSLTKAGDGLLVLSAVNAYSGGTTINGGTLRTDVVDSIASSSNLTINSGVFNLNGNNQLVNNLAGAGGQIELNGATLTANNGSDSRFAGNIVDGLIAGGVLNKTGNGSLTLSGQTAWTGDTHLNGGTLILDGSQGGAQLNGNIIAADNTAFQLHNGASLTGRIDPTDVSIDGTSRWNMTDNSQVNTMNLAGNLTFAAPTTAVMSSGHTLTTGNWVGQNGTLTLNTVLGGDDSVTDKLVINGNTSGNTLVHINNIGGQGKLTNDGIELIDVQGQSDGTFTKDGRIVARAYDYDIVKKGADWYLSSNHVRPEAASYATNLQAANTLFSLSHIDRAGDLSNKGAHDSSLWMRNEGGHQHSAMADGQNQTQANRYVLQLGGDMAQGSAKGVGQYKLGVMAGYANQNSTSHNQITGISSQGNISGYSAGVYGNWSQDAQTNTGWYGDSWLQYNHFSNEVQGDELAAEHYSSQGLTASLESGYTFKVSGWKTAGGMDNSILMTPRAQATWMGVKAKDNTEANGTQVHGTGSNNVQTKLGLRANLNGKGTMNNGRTPQFSSFVEANWIHNTQQFGVMMDDTQEHVAGTRNAGEVKAGVSTQLISGLNLSLDVAQQVGSKGYRDTQGVLGVKYNF